MNIGAQTYEKDFTIHRRGEGIYVKRAVLNDRELQKYSIAVTEMMKNGHIKQ